MLTINSATIHGNEIVYDLTYGDGSQATWTQRPSNKYSGIQRSTLRLGIAIIEKLSEIHDGPIVDWYKPGITFPKELLSTPEWEGPIHDS